MPISTSASSKTPFASATPQMVYHPAFLSAQAAADQVAWGAKWQVAKLDKQGPQREWKFACHMSQNFGPLQPPSSSSFLVAPEQVHLRKLIGCPYNCFPPQNHAEYPPVFFHSYGKLPVGRWYLSLLFVHYFVDFLVKFYQTICSFSPLSLLSKWDLSTPALPVPSHQGSQCGAIAPGSKPARLP